jgi:para-nitrobenzyl esterase
VCAQNTADCVHHASVTDLVDNFGMEIPGVVDGAVLTESIGTALANGRFARVPILNGITHDEERLFVDGLGLAVSGAAEYPPGSYSSPEVAFSTLVSDAKFACPALRLDRLTSTRVPTFAYQFNDDNAPVVIAPPGHFPAVATHDSELPYLFDQPNTPFPATLDPDQQTLAASMRAVWTNFAAGGNASSASLLWPSYTDGARILPLNTPQSTVESDYESTHHCAFWAAG